MAVIEPGEQEEAKCDMTPMIDMIFLLLIFFILTTKFITPEKAVSSLLPTDKGSAAASPPKVEPPQDVNIRIYPVGMARGMQPSELQGAWNGGPSMQSVVMAVGNQDTITIDGMRLTSKARSDHEPELLQIHAYISKRLAEREKAGKSRKEQDPVMIHCFSGLPWKYALAAYDAGRSYERELAGRNVSSVKDLEEARVVSFGAPRVRNYDQLELGNELYEIVNMR
jgi:hypothetical protein